MQTFSSTRNQGGTVRLTIFSHLYVIRRTLPKHYSLLLTHSATDVLHSQVTTQTVFFTRIALYD
jgi:hypothetical protein